MRVTSNMTDTEDKTTEDETSQYPSKEDVPNHVERDGWIWDDEKGWRPDPSKK